MGQAEQENLGMSVRSPRPGRGVLVVNVQGFGDVVCSIPLLKAICKWTHHRWPVYVLLASPAHFELVRAEELPVIPLYVSSGLLWLIRDLRRCVDLIVGMPEISRKKLLLLRAAVGAKTLITERGGESRWTRPFLEAEDEIAAELGIADRLPSPSITITRAESEWAAQQIERAGLSGRRPLIGVHCTSGVPAKSWPADRFGRVVARFAEDQPDLAVISFGTRSERREADSARQFTATTAWLEGTGQWSIRQSLAMLAQCDLFLSGDTGLMHMAAAVGTKTVSIFGPTSASRRAPAYNEGIALHPETSCYPCYRGRWTPCDCLKLVSVDQVVRVIAGLPVVAQADHR